MKFQKLQRIKYANILENDITCTNIVIIYFLNNYPLGAEND